MVADKKNTHIIMCLISMLIIIDIAWSINNDLKFFYWDKIYNANSILFYCVMKCIYVVLLICLGNILYRTIINFNVFFAKFKEWIKCVWLVLIVYVVLTLTLWPGNWGAVGDEIQVLLSIKNLRIWPDQGAMSSIFMILCEMIYPDPGVISLIQCIISIILIGNLIKNVSNELKSKGTKLLVSILFVTPPALCFVLCPIRIWIYSLLLLSLIEELYLLNGNKSVEEKQRMIRIIIILCTLVSNYRSEGLVFIFICPVVFIFFSGVNKNRLRIIIFQMIFLLTFTLMLKLIVNLGNGNTLNQHSGIKYVTVLSMILSDDKKYAEINPADIENINKVYDVSVMIENPSMSAAFDGVRAERTFKEPSKEQMHKFKKSAFKIISRNIPVFLACRWESAKWGMGVYPYYRTVGTVWTQENIETWNIQTDLPGDISKDFKKYSNKSLREWLSTRIVSAFFIGEFDSFYFFYAFWFPCLLLPFIMLINVIRREWLEAFICFCIIFQLIIVILMAPARLQMYYLPFYFIGWFEMIRTMQKVKKGIKMQKICQKSVS